VFITGANPQLTTLTAVAKETSGLLKSKVTPDEIITMWQAVTRGYKIVNPELPHLSGYVCVKGVKTCYSILNIKQLAV
jgi:hypothetical protein